MLLVPLCALLVILIATSWRKETNIQPHCMGLNLGRKSGAPKKHEETPELSINFILLCLHFQNKSNSRRPVLQFTANRKQPSLRPKSLFLKQYSTCA